MIEINSYYIKTFAPKPQTQQAKMSFLLRVLTMGQFTRQCALPTPQ